MHHVGHLPRIRTHLSLHLHPFRSDGLYVQGANGYWLSSYTWNCVRNARYTARVCVCRMQKTEILFFSGSHFLTRDYGVQQHLSTSCETKFRASYIDSSALKLNSAFVFCNNGTVSVLLRSPCTVRGRSFHFTLKMKQVFFSYTQTDLCLQLQ